MSRARSADTGTMLRAVALISGIAYAVAAAAFFVRARRA
jgi:hypothetical protein